jgi:hypothetical protein
MKDQKSKVSMFFCWPSYSSLLFFIFFGEQNTLN